MTPPSPRAFSLFQDVLDLSAPEREAWLASAAADPALRAEVESLLDYHGREDGPLDRPLLTRTDAPPTTTSTTTSTRPTPPSASRSARGA